MQPVHVPLVHVGMGALHIAHEPPELPHALFAVPAAHMLPLQQPWLQLAPKPHDVPHWKPVQAWPTGQSLGIVQPQNACPKLMRHALPCPPIVQSVQAPPPVPHALDVFPAWQVWVLSQQPRQIAAAQPAWHVPLKLQACMPGIVVQFVQRPPLLPQLSG